ncbi:MULTISPECIES: c-type cytochrome [Ralstonia solanacearum species complex]|uniref:Oxidoreductase cytochrome c-type protein n=3 Tax=Ralstonia solanacearum TaxID=305 RepID=A0ABF7RGQ9_RALSL|nr:c-type cytochrome [Ralstonia solanacearum]ALF86869.1 Cytochrome c4 [Ralstonia solanacearum]AST33411.1 cytochrome c4 [Ralstonia solanacearum]ATI26434.1 cytochrome c4 [Ralstonia solanacearum]ATJ85205.1 cytochrome c4 [Ralstonia solanacearum]AYB50446.1 cytochrome c4 [Ralstonia solanacearum]
MNRIANVLAVAALSLASALPLAHAEEQKVAKADAARGETLFNTGVPANGVPACTSCHGPGGNSTANANPKLAGQHAAYIEKQLKDFKAKTERNQPVMSLYAGALSDQDMKDIGAYVAKQPAWKPGSAKNKDTIELGQKLYRGGDAKRGIAACAGCHGPTGAGIPAQYPRIGGQFAEYTEAQLVAFQNGSRSNSVQMHDLAGRMTAQQIKAVADYIAGLR